MLAQTKTKTEVIGGSKTGTNQSQRAPSQTIAAGTAGPRNQTTPLFAPESVERISLSPSDLLSTEANKNQRYEKDNKINRKPKVVSNDSGEKTQSSNAVQFNEKNLPGNGRSRLPLEEAD